MSFDESVFPVGFNQKTAKEDLFVKGNYIIPSRNRHGKTLEDSRRWITKAKPVSLTCGAGQPHLEAAQPMGPPCQPPVAISVLHCLKDCISTIYSNRFDPRAHVGPSGLYNLAPTTPLRHKPHLILRAEKPETLIHMSTRIKASNQEKISPRWI